MPIDCPPAQIQQAGKQIPQPKSQTEGCDTDYELDDGLDPGEEPDVQSLDSGGGGTSNPPQPPQPPKFDD